MNIPIRLTLSDEVCNPQGIILIRWFPQGIILIRWFPHGLDNEPFLF